MSIDDDEGTQAGSRNNAHPINGMRAMANNTNEMHWKSNRASKNMNGNSFFLNKSSIYQESYITGGTERDTDLRYFNSNKRTSYDLKGTVID